MKYKVGDKVRIKSFDWYYSNSDCMGDIQCGDWYFTISQASYCGKVLTISAICDDFYMMKGIGHHWTDEMIEGIVDEPQEKMVSLEDVCAFLDEHLYTGRSTGDYDYGQEYIVSDFNNATYLILTLRKKFEE